MYSDDDLLPLSKLADFVFCPRRAALHLLERIWQDNLLTAEGTGHHDRVHSDDAEARDDMRIIRSLHLCSRRLGLIGIADVIEFHPDPNGISLPNIPGLYRPFPVEYKSSQLKHELGYDIQLCAQALCLEEMLHTSIPAGALFYGKSHRRQNVVFDATLRTATETASHKLHDLIASQRTPAAQYSKKCPHCSLVDYCKPKITSVEKRIDIYIQNACDAAQNSDIESDRP